MMLRALVLLSALLLPSLVYAGEEAKPDDMISVNLVSEGWVQAKAARVTVSVNAAVVGEKASSTRDTMIKAVGDLASKTADNKTEWRLTSFNRNQDPSGIEQWVALFEARLPESELGGIQAKAKTASKAGMQIAVVSVDFSPTLAEFEAVRAQLRKELMAQATKELETINAAYPDRKFRIANISFGGAGGIMQPQVMMMKGRMAMMDAQVASAPQMEGVTNSMGGVETSQKIEMNASVSFAALAPVTPAAK
ncbi:MAG: hypothetical protein SFW65_02295 [Alphaproteobacteria bacterium]|nr:hypothetical protein [Alphaproteobacteria bacterium]